MSIMNNSISLIFSPETIKAHSKQIILFVGLKLVQIRAEAMQLASEAYKGGMATVFYGPDSKLNYACLQAREWALNKGDEQPECCIANYLYPHCKVVSGSEEALNFLEKNAKEFKLKKVKRLPVSGAFHSSLMQPALEPFKKALNKSEIKDPIISVYSNVDGKRYRNADHIRKQLPKQVHNTHVYICFLFIPHL